MTEANTNDWTVRDMSIMSRAENDNEPAMIVGRGCSLHFQAPELAAFVSKRLGLDTPNDDPNVGVMEDGTLRIFTLVESRQNEAGYWRPALMVCSPHSRPYGLRLNDGEAPLTKEAAIDEAKNLVVGVEDLYWLRARMLINDMVEPLIYGTRLVIVDLDEMDAETKAAYAWTATQETLAYYPEVADELANKQFDPIAKAYIESRLPK